MLNDGAACRNRCRVVHRLSSAQRKMKCWHALSIIKSRAGGNECKMGSKKAQLSNPFIQALAYRDHICPCSK
jgi:hypothetical protein